MLSSSNVPDAWTQVDGHDYDLDARWRAVSRKLEKVLSDRLEDNILPRAQWEIILGAHALVMASKIVGCPGRRAAKYAKANASSMGIDIAHAAAASGFVSPRACWQVIDHSIGGADVIDSLEMTPLHWASLHGQFEWMRALIACGATVDMVSSTFDTPLSIACRHNKPRAIDILLEAGACADGPAQAVQAPLHVAADLGFSGVIKQLCAAGADIENTNMDGCTPLLIAVCKEQIDAVNALVECGADVNSPGTTQFAAPLHIAAANGHVSMVHKLVEVGARLEPRCSESGMTPLMWAVAAERSATVKALLDCGASTTSVSTREGESSTKCTLET